MRLLLSNNKQLENSVNKDGMGTWGNQQSAVQTGGEATPADNYPYTTYLTSATTHTVIATTMKLTTNAIAKFHSSSSLSVSGSGRC
jgi:hypothetical protein